jgi:signal transduction histidine kinase/ActR/RegA family two-component response regulator
MSAEDKLASYQRRFERERSARKQAETLLEAKSLELYEINQNLATLVAQKTEELQLALHEAKKANKAKSNFLANMSHEIRTPLNAILGFIDILKSTENDGKKLSYLNIVSDSSKSLLNIINDILDFSKIESGKLEIDEVDFNPLDEINFAINLFKAKAQEKSITLKTDIKNLPSCIHSDNLRLQQVLSNLLSNAIKFTSHKGSVIVSASCENQFLNISIKDSGIGIEKSKQKTIFEAFSQEDNSTTRKFGGTGLGLAICSKLVAMLGGEIKLESEISKGSTFSFSIKAKKVDSVIENKKLEVKNVMFNNQKVLLVEDIKANQVLMKVLFKSLNLEVDVANDGLEAIEKFKKQTYSIIFMDENMPNLNGLEATKKILEVETDNKINHTPIIALTANALKGDKERFIAEGMDDYLSKPVKKEQLVSILKKYI